MKKEPFQVSVNDQYHFDLHPDEAKTLDFIATNNASFHALENGQAFQVELLETDYANRRYTLRINGNKYTVDIADYYERLVKKLGLSAGGSHKINTVKAPMPGLVISVLVEPGQTVSKGDPLLILEAMKMENVIKAAGDGIVKAVTTQNGQPVEKGHTLVEFE
ncbi:MAG: acetyl-CoA carboxylase biotin carboxyl carrier protein subunit [Saprospirales bacterium]|nr:acetyl-CoA carboxylase biotin carboxyl carrier protein subunit [Saprospirales bacterium]MBK8921731.1 acetyl-CoA carboxylase biotin carboxyl carrier protein subunit [Saprospirales bacterium]